MKLFSREFRCIKYWILPVCNQQISIFFHSIDNGTCTQLLWMLPILCNIDISHGIQLTHHLLLNTVSNHKMRISELKHPNSLFLVNAIPSNSWNLPCSMIGLPNILADHLRLGNTSAVHLQSCRSRG